MTMCATIKNLVTAAVVLSGWTFCLAGEIKIHLPREIQLDENRITVGSVCAVTGDEQLKDEVSLIGLGVISVPGQEIVIDRGTITARLVSSGVSKKSFTFTGAEEMKIKGYSKTITAQDYLKTAEKFMQENFKDKACKWQLIKAPNETIFDPDGIDFKLEAEFDNFNNKYQKRVIVKAVNDNGIIDKQYVMYEMKYKCKQAVAVENIARNQLFTPDNIKLEEVYENSPQQGSFTPPYGMAAKRDINAGEVIRQGSYENPKPIKVVKRNETVLVSIDMEGLKLVVPGEVQQDGFAGDLVKVKVKVTEEARTIVAKVKEDGTVEPIM